jgi:ribosomal protein L11 methyltransferase
MADMIRLDFVAEDEDADIITGILVRLVSYGWEENSLPTGETRFTVHCENVEVVDELCAAAAAFAPQVPITRTIVPHQDWQAAWRDFFTPVECGKFVVLPPWLLKDAPAHLTPIVIEPKCAFGTGHHNTTVLCLTALSELIDAGRLKAGMRFFDLGTGTGILGIGCALSGLTGVGSDIDPLAVDNASENVRINDVSNFEIRSGSVEAAGDEMFDVVVANILAGPLRELAPGIMGRMKDGAVLVLSGILTVQADAVAEAYSALGEPKRFTSGDWTALVWA